VCACLSEFCLHNRHFITINLIYILYKCGASKVWWSSGGGGGVEGRVDSDERVKHTCVLPSVCACELLWSLHSA